MDSGEEITILLPGEDNERKYFHMSAEGDHYIYEYLTITSRGRVLYVMHDFVPVYYEDGELYFEFAFLLNDGKFTYIDDKEEVKRLYEEYHEKYPCDTSEVEDMMNRGNDCVSDFHF